MIIMTIMTIMAMPLMFTMTCGMAGWVHLLGKAGRGMGRLDHEAQAEAEGK